MKDEQNPRCALQALNTDLLLAASNGLVDLQALARYELLARNVTLSGVNVKPSEITHAQTEAYFEAAVSSPERFEEFIQRRNRAAALGGKS